ncbi:MAG: efflux RND transporter permease subunit, partial [Planctomycetaceae bacterium]|nr:efflux RND transporter permease subunit [Planctomycetaceae bacterium]
VLFLLHVRSSIVVALTLPLAVLMAFIAMNVFGIDANIMSLAGIAIAIGTMVDMGIVVSESIYDQLAEWEAKGKPGGKAARLNVINVAAAEVAPAVVTAVMTTVVSFFPVFMLTGRDYKLFAPLAWTKTFSITAALIVAITLVPLLSRLFLASQQRTHRRRILISVVFALVCGILVWSAGETLVSLTSISLTALILGVFLTGGICSYWLLSERLRPVDENPIGRLIHFLYEPTLRFFMRHKLLFFSFPTLVVLLGMGAWVGMPTVLKPFEGVARFLGVDANEVPGWVEAKHLFPGLESNDWIALDEGSWFYMPTLYPAASFTQAMEVLQTQDAMIKEIPEVENVLGKIGRVD